MITYNTPSNLMFKNVKREVEDVKVDVKFFNSCWNVFY